MDGSLALASVYSIGPTICKRSNLFFMLITSGYLFMDQVTRVVGPMLSYGDQNVPIPFESEEEVACSFLME